MDLKEKLKNLVIEMEKPIFNKIRVASLTTDLAADLEEEETQVPGDVLDVLDNQVRKTALMGFLALIAQTLQEQ